MGQSRLPAPTQLPISVGHSGLWTDSDEDSGPDRIKSSHPVYLQRDTHVEIQISSFSGRPPKASYLALSADQSEKAFQHWTLHIILHSDAQTFKCSAKKNNKLFDFRGSSVNSETITLFDIRGSYVIVQTNKSDILFQCMYYLSRRLLSLRCSMRKCVMQSAVWGSEARQHVSCSTCQCKDRSHVDLPCI